MHTYETPSCLPTQIAVTLFMYTLIPTVYRALLKSAVSGIGLWIHTTKKMLPFMWQRLQRLKTLKTSVCCSRLQPDVAYICTLHKKDQEA